MEGGSLTFTHLRKVLADYGQRVQELYVDEFERRGKVASGKLQKSVSHEVVVGDRTVSVVLELEDYWRYVEFGRRPGKMPPLNKILEWIKIKPVIPRPNKHGRIPRPEQRAFAIGLKISREGVAPTPMLQDTLSTVNREFEQRIFDAIDEDLTDDVTEQIDLFFTR